ncbi:hypothetical protein [Cupriavidus sp. D39]|uniref:hypothetical protein n=1 Tax=Cupriavidus sp. D39 TaxID=2997877 RepID=UPI0022714C0D|nr:hypothetical protein [Cupriavidus sp. D39]MCY0852983.1 hypothetical protein [Cupriavidus sp. D39]
MTSIFSFVLRCACRARNERNADGRKQGIYTFDPDDRLLLVPCMADGPAGRDGRGIGWTLPLGVRAKNSVDHERVKALLESPDRWSFLRRRGKQWSGGHRSFALNLLRQVPEMSRAIAPAAPRVVDEVLA